MLPRIYGIESKNRKKQINTLKVFNENVIEVTEDYEYQVSFRAGGIDFCMNVALTNNFPNEKPILKMVPIVIHPWVNSTGEITGAPGLMNFTLYSDLGRVVQAVIREFQRTPPPLCDKPNVISSPSIPINDADADQASPVYQQNVSGLNNFSPPSKSSATTYSLAFPELNSLSLEELEFLNESEHRREEFIESLPQVHDMNKTLEDLISQVDELTDSNLSMQEHLEELQEGIGERLEEVTKLTFENERLHSQYQNLSEKYAPRNIQGQLRLAAEKAEKDSEKIAESFLSGKLTVEKFLKIYIRARTLCQTRKTKEEKFSQQLNSLEKAGF